MQITCSFSRDRAHEFVTTNGCENAQAPWVTNNFVEAFIFLPEIQKGRDSKGQRFKKAEIHKGRNSKRQKFKKARNSKKPEIQKARNLKTLKFKIQNFKKPETQKFRSSKGRNSKI